MSYALVTQTLEQDCHKYLKVDPKATRTNSCHRITPKPLENLIQEKKNKEVDLEERNPWIAGRTDESREKWESVESAAT